MPRREVYIDQALTNFAQGYKPTGFIADIVSPIVNVVKPSAKFYEWDRLDSFRTYNDLRAPGTEANVIEEQTSKNYYNAEEHSLAATLTDEDKKNQDNILKLEQTKTKKIKTALLLGREKRVAEAYADLTTYHSNLKEVLTGADQWDNENYTGNVVLEIDSRITAVYEETGQAPNTLILPWAVADVIKNRPEITELMKYTKGDLLEGMGLPKYIRGLKVEIAGASTTNGAPGASTAGLSRIWGKNIIVAYINKDTTPDYETFSACYTFRNENFKTDKWYDEPKKTSFIRTSFSEDIKRTSNVAAFIKKDVIG